MLILVGKEKVQYDWIVVGGGIAGISIAEILCRGEKNVLLLEKNKTLASETSKVFHEWLHSGTLYTLAPDNLLTLRYLLGATDDLFEFYSSYSNMNLIPTEKGVSISPGGWFNQHNILYKYRVHKFNPFWMMTVSRSMNLIDMVSSHDWLRRRAGAEYGKSRVNSGYFFSKIPEQVGTKGKFIQVISPDITMNSRQLLSDMVDFSLNHGLDVRVDSYVVDINDGGDHVTVTTNDNKFIAKNVVMCSPDLISKLYNQPIQTGYAPIAVVEGLDEEQRSFVELDYNVKKCINLIVKKNGVGQAGGITLKRESEVSDYLEYVISEHKKRTPGIKVLGSYVGLKKELVQKSEERNYLYHINRASSRVWSVILGKFSLAFSMAPEFYRRVYHKNPTKIISSFSSSENRNLISETAWQEIVTNKEKI